LSQYNHLKKYPYLLRFCGENQIPILPYLHGYDQLLLSDIVASSIPDQSIDDFESRKKVIDKCLEFGHRHGILDSNKRSRLKSKDPIQFWSTVSEMKIGVWLEEQGIKIICFEPPSENGGKGDYLIRGNRHIVFIEVKTLFGENYMLEQERLTGDIAQHCQSQKLPVERVNLVHYPRDYDYSTNKFRLLKEVEELIRKNLPLAEKRTVSYSEPNGIEIEIALDPGASRVLSRMYGGFSSLLDDLKIRLGMCVEGVQAKLQTSAESIPSVCIIDDLSFNIDDVLIESVLYGNLVDDHTKPPAVVYYRKNDGKWSSSSPSELSSVFILKFVPATTKVKTLSAYLCPNPKYELSKSTFPEVKIVWWKLDKKGIFVEAPRLLNGLYLLSALFKSLINRCYRFLSSYKTKNLGT